MHIANKCSTRMILAKQDRNTSREQENGSQTDDSHMPEKPIEDKIEGGKKQNEVELRE